MAGRQSPEDGRQLIPNVAEAYRRLRHCELCPRRCGVDRVRDERGFCRTGRRARLASFGAHFGEEAPLVGSGGSGTLFLSECNLRCVFCQNWDISWEGAGVEVGLPRLAEVMLELQRRGCANINWVTPSHVVPQLLGALCLARRRGLRLPIVYNSSGYDAVDTLRLLQGAVDIYMPDLKWLSAATGETLAAAPDYGVVARAALREMHRQVGDLELGPDGLARRGLLVRHLVMPAGLAGTREVMAFISREISPATYVNIMPQYRPCGKAGKIKELSVSISRKEYEEALRAAMEEGISRLDRRRRVFMMD